MRPTGLEAAELYSPDGRHLWDSQYFPASEAFHRFRDHARSVEPVWTSEQSGRRAFKLRTESFAVTGGRVGRLRSVPLQYLRTTAHIKRTSSDYFYAVLVMSGSAAFEQDDTARVVQGGDLFFLDTGLPWKLTTSVHTEAFTAATLFLLIHKTALSKGRIRGHAGKILTRANTPAPLSSVLYYLSNRLLAANREELEGLYSAAVSLLPVALGFREEAVPPVRAAPDTFRALGKFIEQCLAEPCLSATYAAQELGVSERYVHKLFATMGTTFGAYVMAKRLDCARADLSAADKRIPISTVALKWGFGDLSTFNRAFKRRFGCTPRAIRD